MPRSPWLASAACTKKAGVPVEASGAAILRPTCPDLPMPVTITRARASRIVSTAATKCVPRLSDIAAANAQTPSRSVSSVRSAEAMKACGLGFRAGPSAELMFACVPNRGLPLSPFLPTSSSDGSLLFPGGESLGEGAVAGRAFFHRQDGAAAVGVDDRDVEPRALFEELQVALDVGVDRGKPDEEESVGDLDRKS